MGVPEYLSKRDITQATTRLSRKCNETLCAICLIYIYLDSTFTVAAPKYWHRIP